ncbi:MAG: discoidin domain-containing protein [Gemmatimonadota bacterium]
MIVVAVLAALFQAPVDSAFVIDGFETVDRWTAHPADGVSLAIGSGPGRTGRAMRLDFDFHRGAGYAIARRALDLDLPDNYVFTFWVRGEAPANTLEFKLLDRTGENVWWHVERDVVWSRTWKQVKIRRRQIQFAWGPNPAPEIRKVFGLEIVVTAGKRAGKGSVWIDDLALTRLPPADSTPIAPVVAATSDSTVEIDLQSRREFGGVALQWEAGRRPDRYRIERSLDRRRWELLAERVRAGASDRDYLFLPDSEARYLRLRARPRGGPGAGLREVRVEPLAWSASREAFVEGVAKDAPRGTYPRYLSGERIPWTVVGVDRAPEEALFNVDGAVEPVAGAYSIEPFLVRGDSVISWAQVTAVPRWHPRAVPIPSVVWSAGPIELTVTAIAYGPAAAAALLLDYQVRNSGAARERLELRLVARPFQVDPPWQFLNSPGGVGRIDSLRWTGRALVVNGTSQVIPRTRPARVSVAGFDGGDVVGSGNWGLGAASAGSSARDSLGLASAGMAFPMDLRPGDSARVTLDLPLTARATVTSRGADVVARGVADTWDNVLSRSGVELPDVGTAITESIRASIAYILINRDGPAIQPGSRSYARSWIRDGALTSSALLRFGHPDVVRDFIRWFAPYQYPNGKVPCCVDHRGADPVPEHDSHGEFVFLVAEYFRHTGDSALVREMWPRIDLAIRYLDSLRSSTRTAAANGDSRTLFGLLPPSISHEGYSAKPAYSYWDDFFALRGFKDAAFLAGVVIPGDLAREDRTRAPHPPLAPTPGRLTEILHSRDQFAADLHASILASMAEHRIDYIPGAAELGDFDATSTTIALDPVNAGDVVPRDALERTFERFWTEVEGRSSGAKSWDAYTPYELRAVGALVRLGWKEKALRLLNGYLADQEPVAWHQWPEVVWRDHRAPKFIGDLPHTWVASDFLRSAADLFAYERESDSALVVGAGVDERWLTGRGVRVTRLQTWWGPVSYTMTAEAGRVRVRLQGGFTVPKGGVRVASPRLAQPRQVCIDTDCRPWTGGELVRVDRVPVDVSFDY